MSYRRTLAAFLLTVVAVAVPCVTWYFAGSRQVEREAHLKQKIVHDRAYKKAVMLAERLATRLEVLRESESRRPFYYYQNLYHDPKVAAEGASVSISPLAQGPADPLIQAHFQIGFDGELTLPTLNEDFPELSLQDVDHSQCALLEELEDVAVFCRRDEGLASTPGYSPRSGPALAIDDGRSADCLAGSMEPIEARVEEMPAFAWQQHLAANRLYGDLKYGRTAIAGVANGAAGLAVPAGGRRPVRIEVGPFEWRTLPLGGQPGLVALRAVATPAGVLTQGFTISARAIDGYLEDAPYPATFAPYEILGGRRERGRVAVAVQGTPWGVGLDFSRTLALAVAESRADADRFLRIFLLCVGAAGVAGLLVVSMVRQSERLASQRAQFAASAAHELRTPIAGLRLYGEMLAEGLGDQRRSKEYARRVAGEAERLGRVVTNVLSFTRLERKTLSVDPREGDLGAAVGDAVARQKPALEEAGAEVELEVPADLPPVRFDTDAVANILQNLLDNAEKYTRGVEERKVTVRLEATPRAVRLVVADNGHGVPRALRRKLFEPFHRGVDDVDRADAPAGLGLGLVLVEALTRAQGGDIRYSDAPGGGAVFTVRFPR